MGHRCLRRCRPDSAIPPPATAPAPHGRRYCNCGTGALVGRARQSSAVVDSRRHQPPRSGRANSGRRVSPGILLDTRLSSSLSLRNRPANRAASTATRSRFGLYDRGAGRVDVDELCAGGGDGSSAASVETRRPAHGSASIVGWRLDLHRRTRRHRPDSCTCGGFGTRASCFAYGDLLAIRRTAMGVRTSGSARHLALRVQVRVSDLARVRQSPAPRPGHRQQPPRIETLIRHEAAISNTCSIDEPGQTGPTAATMS